MEPIRKILVPVDFSDASRKALRQAVELAKHFGAQVELLHVWEPPRYISPDMMLAMPGWSAISLEELSYQEAHKALGTFLEVEGHPELAPVSRVDTGTPA